MPSSFPLLTIDLARPEWLWALAGLPALLACLRWARRAQQRRWRALGQTSALPGDRRIAWAAAYLLLVLALAQPRWGFRPGLEPAPGHDVVLLVDLSRSMAAEDAVPSRLGASVEAAERLVRDLGLREGERVAVVGFAGRGSIACPLTENLGAAVDRLRSLRAGSISPGGSDLGAGLEAAFDAFGLDQLGPEGGRSIVVFSDGEDLEEHWRVWLSTIRESGITVHTIAVGDDAQGHPIPWPDPQGASRPIQFEGQTVLSRRQDEPLRALALATGGTFVPLGVSAAEGRLLDTDRIASGAREARLSSAGDERAERFPAFVFPALVLVLFACFTRPGRRRVASNRAARLAVATATVVGFLSGADGPGSSRVADLIARGNREYATGQHELALDAFREAARLAPGDPIPTYNAAASLFQLGRYDEAAHSYESSRTGADDAMKARIDYALGNAAVAMRDIPRALASYDACLASTVPGPEMDRLREDARINREFAQKLADLGEAPSEEPNAPSNTQGDGDGDDSPENGGSPDPTPPGGGEPPGPSDEPPPNAPTTSTGDGGGDSPDDSTDLPPAERLARAMDAIRRAEGSRLPDESPPTRSSGPERRDW